ncbi:MAG: HAD-IB family phosphatase [Gammaproteobacteria bacterium]|nr:HAD-IB family phosphatase [Gammaproteobacteria bacterium]
MTAQSAYRLVIFDCDSTLTRIEGVDELARRIGVEREIAALTAAAMEGRVPLEEIYGRRLEKLRPDRSSIRWLGERYIEEQMTGAAETVGALREAGVEVRIVSGGFLPAVSMLGGALGLRTGQVHSVELRFAPDGSYLGFDTASPLVRSGGKGVVCAELMQHFGRCVAVGDGVTDLEMQDAGAEFIGFGGVVERDAVRRRAARYVAAPDLREILGLVCNREG